MTQKRLIYLAIALAILYVATQMGKTSSSGLGGWPPAVGGGDD